MISKYTDFILESVINESIIYYTPPVLSILHKMKDNEVAKALIDISATDIKPDITFVDFGAEGYFQFSTIKNVRKILSKNYKSFGEGESDDIAVHPNDFLITSLWNRREEELDFAEIFNKSRNPVKIGRMVNTIFPGKFTSKQIEDFVNEIKSKIEKSAERFELVSGDDIAKWYDSKTYKETNGSLGNSCMANKDKYYFEVYTENPQVCQMLILLEDDKLIGRALIWKVSGHDKSEYFMDRQYTIKESDVNKFRNYANEKKWAYKTYNNHYTLDEVTFNYDSTSIELEVQVNKHDDDYYYDSYPYMDTFRKYDPKTGILKNNDNKEDSKGLLNLSSTSGSYATFKDEDDDDEYNDEDYCYSEYYEDDIQIDSAVWSDPIQSWIYRNSAEEVTRGSRSNIGFYPEAYDDVVYEEFSSEHFHIDDCVYSEAYSSDGHGYIFRDDAVKTVVEISDGIPYRQYESENYDYYHKNDRDITKLSKFENRNWFDRLNEDSDWDEIEAIIDELIDRDYRNRIILTEYTISTFLLKTEYEKKRFYLTKEDAKMLNFELEDDSVEDYERKTDWFDYYKEIERYSNEEITLFRDKPFTSIKEIYDGLDVDDDSDRIEFIEKFYSVD